VPLKAARRNSPGSLAKFTASRRARHQAVVKLGLRSFRWKKSGPTTTGWIFLAAYTTRCAGNIQISSFCCAMHRAEYWLATMGLRFRRPQRQLGEINRHRPRLVAGQQLGR